MLEIKNRLNEKIIHREELKTIKELLEDVDKRDANLEGAKLENTNLEGANLLRANLEDVHLEDSETSIFNRIQHIKRVIQ